MSSLPPVPQPPYTQHTQHNNWRFSQEQLLKRRQDNLRASLARLASTPEQEVTLEDQLDLCSFYEGRLVTLARALKYSDAVLGTAIAFFRRFYLKHSILDHSPATLIFPCLYLSLKAEDNFIPMDQFVTKVKKSLSDGEAILAMEFCLSSSLGFQFAIRHPYRPLYGFFLNAQRHCKDRPILRRIHKEAKARVRTALLTDAPLIYSPSQIALAVLSHTIYQQGTPDLKSKYLAPLIKSHPLENVPGGLAGVLDSINALIDAYSPTPRERATQCDAKRKALTSLMSPSVKSIDLRDLSTSISPAPESGAGKKRPPSEDPEAKKGPQNDDDNPFAPSPRKRISSGPSDAS